MKRLIVVFLMVLFFFNGCISTEQEYKYSDTYDRTYEQQLEDYQQSLYDAKTGQTEQQKKSCISSLESFQQQLEYCQDELENCQSDWNYNEFEYYQQQLEVCQQEFYDYKEQIEDCEVYLNYYELDEYQGKLNALSYELDSCQFWLEEIESEGNYIADKCTYIVKFNYDASGNDHYNLNDEYVIFGNKCHYSIDITGWIVKDEIVSHTYVIPQFIFQGGATFTLYTGLGINTASKLYWGRTDGAVWNNDGDTLFFRDDNENLILTYSYIGD